MERYAIGDKVHSALTFEHINMIHPDDECPQSIMRELRNRLLPQFKGTVVGHGCVNNLPVIMVSLEEGGYITNSTHHSYVQVIPVCPDYLEKD